MNNKINTGVPIYSEYVSETQAPSFSEPTYTNKIIFDSTVYEKN